MVFNQIANVRTWVPLSKNTCAHMKCQSLHILWKFSLLPRSKSCPGFNGPIIYNQIHMHVFRAFLFWNTYSPSSIVGQPPHDRGAGVWYLWGAKKVGRKTKTSGHITHILKTSVKQGNISCILNNVMWLIFAKRPWLIKMKAWMYLLTYLMVIFFHKLFEKNMDKTCIPMYVYGCHSRKFHFGTSPLL